MAPHPPSPAAGGPAHEPREQWTYVTGKRRKGAKGTRGSLGDGAAVPPAPHAPLRSPSAIAAEYHRIRSAWAAPPSPCCLALRALAADSAACCGPVERAVCLGIGTFDPPDGGWEAKRRTYLQLIAFLVMVDELEKHTGQTIPCLFQEPVFTSADRAFIASLGHRVVDSPEGFDRVDPYTFLFGVHLYRPIYAMALRNHLPALFVGTGWDVWHHVSLSESHDLHHLQEMERTYAKAGFPQDPSITAFSSTSVYWRTSASARRQSAEAQADTNSKTDRRHALPSGTKAESERVTPAGPDPAASNNTPPATTDD